MRLGITKINITYIYYFRKDSETIGKKQKLKAQSHIARRSWRDCKNMTVLEYENDIIVIDCGLGFPDDDMLGVDLVIPDVSYLEKNADKVRGFLLTHGHEDHIGALPYYSRRSTPGLGHAADCRHRAKQARGALVSRKAGA